MKAKHGFFTSLKCRECGRHYPKEALHVCEFCFGPLEVDYDYEAIGSVLTRARIQSRPQTMWRYRELLPIDGEPSFAPLVIQRWPSEAAFRAWLASDASQGLTGKRFDASKWRLDLAPDEAAKLCAKDAGVYGAES